MKNKKQLKHLRLNKITIANIGDLKGGKMNHFPRTNTETLLPDLKSKVSCPVAIIGCGGH